MNKQICSERHILFIYYAFLYIFYINSGEVNIKHMLYFKFFHKLVFVFIIDFIFKYNKNVLITLHFK